MKSEQIESLVVSARGLDPDVPLDPNEEWDSLDHLAVLGALQDELGDEFGQIDLSMANSVSKLLEMLGG
jgi:acyl carrier protein